VFGDLIHTRDGMVKAGLSPVEADKALVDAVVASATTSGDKSILKLLDRNVPGADYTFANTPYGKAKREAGESHLDAASRVEVAEGSRKQEKADKAAFTDVKRRTMQWITSNPFAAVPEELLKEGEKYDGEWRIRVLRDQKVVGDALGKDNKEAKKQLYHDIMQGGGQAAVERAFESGAIHSAEDLRGAMDLAEKYEKIGRKADGILEQASAKEILGSIKDRTSDKLSDPLAPDGMSDLGRDLQLTFRKNILEWAAQHPAATNIEQLEAIDKIGKQVLGSFTKAGPGVPAQKVGQGGSGPQQTPSPTPAPEQQQPSQPTQPAKPPEPTQPRRVQLETVQPEAVEWYRGLSDIDRAKVEASASKLGVPVEQRIGEVFGKVKAREVATPEPVPEAPPQPAAPSPDQRSDLGGGTAAQTVAYKPQEAPVGEQPSIRWANTALPEREREGLRGLAARNGTTYEREVEWLYSAQVQEGFVDPKRYAKPVAQPAAPSEDDPVSEDLQRRAREAFTSILSGKQGSTSIGKYANAAIRGDRTASRILDFVSGPESRGNYNAYYGRSGSERDLSQMTMADLAGCMKTRRPYSATGRYQFIYTTLFGKDGASGLFREAGLRPTDRFTPEVQDRLALLLLQRRGYDAWKAGKLSTQAFAKNLASEWASLPSPRTGRSVYAGVAGNRAGVTVRQTLGALDSARDI